MRREDPGIIEPDAAARHRRESVRHRVTVQALMHHPSGETIPCEIVDVSSSGMALEIREAAVGADRASFEPGTSSLVRFSPKPDTEPDETVTARCSVMWLARRSLGVRFEETDATLKSALKQVVHAAIAERKEDEKPGLSEPTARQREILKACRKSLQKQIPNIVWIIRSALLQRLLNLASSGGKHAADAQADAGTLDEKAMSIGLAAEHRFLSSFSDVFQLQRTQELTVAQVRAAMKEAEARATRSGPGDDPAEVDPLLLRVVEEAGARYGDRYRQLDRRLAEICEHEGKDESNPLVPGVACRFLWECFTEHCSSPPARQVLEVILLKHVLPVLGDLYDALDATLTEQESARAAS